MPSGVKGHTKDCTSYDPWAHIGGNKHYAHGPTLSPKEKVRSKLFKKYMRETQEWRDARNRGSITMDQYREATRPQLKALANDLSILYGFTLNIGDIMHGGGM